jgi:myosin heavy subunit
MFCIGAPQDIRSKFEVNIPDFYNYLNQSGCTSIDGVDEYAQFRECLKALNELKFSPAEIENVWRILSGILWAGNLVFEKDGDGSKITTPDILGKVANILKIKTDDLEKALCFRAVTIRNEVQMIKQNAIQASAARDSMNKALYGNLFDWLIFKINEFLCKVTSNDYIGVLDIFGFEVFDHNSFEQFCINLANEKLQQHFNHYIFKMEQNEYKSEGINFSSIEFVDNQECLDLIEGKPGILMMLDEEVVLPKGGDDSLVEKYHKAFAEQTKHKYYDRKRQQKEIFIINHYAGAVIYNIAGFVDKNKDNIHDSLEKAVKSSGCELIQRIFEPPESEEDLSKGGGKGTPKAGGKSKTLGSKFKNQLTALMATLNKTSPHFIRCIKPNMAKVPNTLDSVMVLKQMKYAGLFEAIRVRAQGFSYRKPHEQFFNRYKIILTKDQRKRGHEMKDGTKKCKMILDDMKELEHKDIQIGKTKVFFRSNVLNQLETARERGLMQFTVMMQSVARGIIAKKIYRRMKEVLDKVRKTLNSDDVKQMEETLAYAKKQNVQLFILKQLEEAYLHAKEEERVCKLLEEAIGLKQLEYLDGAISQADNLGLRKEPSKKLLAEAVQVKTHLIAVEKCRKALKSAVLAEDIGNLKSVIEEARNLSFPPDALSDALNALARLEKEELIFIGVEDAIKSGDVAQVEGAIEKTAGISLNPKRTGILTKAKDFILGFYSKKLEEAIDSKDEAAIAKELVLLNEKQLGTELYDLVTKAHAFLEKKKKERQDAEEAARKKAEEEARQKAALEAAEKAAAEEPKGGSAPPPPSAPSVPSPPPSAPVAPPSAPAVEIPPLPPAPQKEEIEIPPLPPPPPGPPPLGLEIIEEDEGKDEPRKPPPPPGPPPGPEWLRNMTTSSGGDKGQLKEKLRQAIAENDMEAVNKILPQVESGGISDASKTMKMGKALMQKANQTKTILANLKKAVEDLDRDRMRDLLTQARDEDIEPEEIILKARKICYGSTEEEFKSLLMKKFIDRQDVEAVKNLIAQCTELQTS